MVDFPHTVAPHAAWPEDLIETLGPAPLWYHCTRCGAPIPDGCFVLVRKSGDKLTGVRVQDHDGNTRHQCGAKVHGHDLTPKERVEQQVHLDPEVQT